MNVILINLESDVQTIKPIMDAIKSSDFVVELPNNNWAVLTDRELSWWNHFIRDNLKKEHSFLDKKGDIRKSYFVCKCESGLISGVMNNKIIEKIKELRDKVKPEAPVKTIQNVFDGMEII